MKKKEMIIDVVKKIISHLVRGEFDVLKEMEMLGPGTCEEYATALHNYLQGREVLCEPPPEAFDTSLHIYEICEANRWRAGFDWRAEFDLWTDRGRSDLTAIIYVKEISPGIGHGILYDLRVL
jgi:hypothetical protein